MAAVSQQQQQQQQQQLPPAIQYREILQECDQLARKIAEFEVDRNEHILVEETLKPLDGSRRAYRLVGDVLVERSVQEVLPSVTSNRENVRLWGLLPRNQVPMGILIKLFFSLSCSSLCQYNGISQHCFIHLPVGTCVVVGSYHQGSP